MNHIFRSIWNASTQTVTAVSEFAKSRGKTSCGGQRAVARSGFILRAAFAALALSCGSASYASPKGATVVTGNASVNSEAGRTTIHQTTQNAALTWQSFDIGVNESVSFLQPNSHSVALNRVLGSDPSSILGSLSSNGKVFLVNPNGILFGTGAQVNVAGLVASTRDITDSDFLAGRYHFIGSGTGSVVNQGAIHADGGYVALLGATVSNNGVIAAKLGSVVLAAGNAVTLDVAGDGLLSLTVNAGAVDALVHNGGMIRADGGHVVLSARSAGALLSSAVNNTGVIQAQTLENRNGTIRLLGDMQSGRVTVAGTLDASAPDHGDGGFIDTSAAIVKVTSSAVVTTAAARGLTGSWLIDPTDYTIASSGGDITGAQLSSALAGSNVIIQSAAGATEAAGDVNVNDSVAWSANTLTLSAQSNININAAMNGSGTASLALQFGQGAVAAGNLSQVNVNAPVNLPTGNNFSTLQGSNGSVVNFTVITSLGEAGSTSGTDLQGMNGNLARNYVLGSNVDAAVTSTWNSGAGFTPVGTGPSRFTGIFDGLGHTISGLYIDRTGGDFTGLFGYTDTGSMVRNVGLIGGSVASNSWGTGALVGALDGSVRNSYATTTVSGFQTVGGLVGVLGGGAIVNSHASGDVVAYGGSGEAGGLVGLIWGTPRGIVSNSYATGNVSSPFGNVGGLVGISWGTVTGSYATGTASGTDNVGGLIGDSGPGLITDSYASGAVQGRNSVGGLVGTTSRGITNSHASGAVIGLDYVGGLAGYLGDGATNSYATGSVSGRHRVGGLVGQSNYGTFTGNRATGPVTASGDNVGGFIGYNYGSTVVGNHASGMVIGRNSVGGFVGGNYGSYYGTAEVSNNYATGAVAGLNFIGGLIGTNFGEVNNSHATGTVTGDDQIGGLVGGFQSGAINTSYATGAVTARTGAAGGLVGYASATINNSYASGSVVGVYQAGGILGAMNGGTITNTYATGSVTGTGNVGGLVGNSANGTIVNAYATGVVTGTTDVGGLLGSNLNATVTSGFWDITTSSQATSAGGTGLTTVQMQSPESFTGFSFTATPGATGNSWVMINFDGTLNGSGGTRPMLASEYSTIVMNAHQLQLMRMDVAASYTLGRSIDATATGTAQDVWASSSFVPVGKENDRFTGTFDGLGHTIDNLQIRLPGADVPGGFGSITQAEHAGLFGYLGAAGVVQNVGLVGGSVVGRDYTGALVGRSDGTVTNSYVTSNVQGRGFVGGLIGYNNASGSVTGSHATGSVTGSLGGVGGLIGINEGALSGNFARGAVQGGEHHVGGLVGYNNNVGAISNSYASGSVTGVNGSSYVGGLVGRNYGDVLNSYASGEAVGFNYVGGLVGGNYGAITNTYSTGLVQSANSAGGLIGSNYGSVSRSFWNTESSGQASSNGGVGLTSAQMMQVSSFSSWNTATPNTISSSGNSGASWRIYEGQTGPLLTQFLTALTLSDNVIVTYNGTAQNGMSAPPSGVLGTTATNAGVYSFYSNQQGYDITGGSLTINRADLTLGGTRTYDGSTIFAGADLTAIGVAGESFALSGSGHASNLSNRNVQSGSPLTTLTGLTLGAGSNGALSSNYNALSVAGSSISITQAALTVASADVIKTYDGTTNAAGAVTIVSGTLVGGDSIDGGTFAFTDKNAGIGDRTVTVTSVVVSDGNSGANYSVAYANNTTSTIDRAVLMATVTADDKIYDGNTAAVATLSLVGLINHETLGASGVAAFDSKDVATANRVTINSIALLDGDNGGLASNYSIASGQTAVAHITPRALAVENQVAEDKIYDGTTIATLRGGSLAGVVSGETVMLTEAGNFLIPNPGRAIAITASDSLSGVAAANYTIVQPLGLAANITTAAEPEAPIVAAPPPVVAVPDHVATSTVAFRSAIGHIAADSRGGVAQGGAPISLGVAPSRSQPVGSVVTYDLSGLNLTVIDSIDASSAVPLQDSEVEQPELPL
jgi:filamentous hemagglutinin family protein